MRTVEFGFEIVYDFYPRVLLAVRTTPPAARLAVSFFIPLFLRTNQFGRFVPRLSKNTTAGAAAVKGIEPHFTTRIALVTTV